MKTEKQIKQEIKEMRKGAEMLNNYLVNTLNGRDVNDLKDSEMNAYFFNLSCKSHCESRISALKWVLENE